jgi:MerR family transcriptional regulator/heat shock protein HspR
MAHGTERTTYAVAWTAFPEDRLSGAPRSGTTEVAARCGVHPRTLRQYERLGLVSPAGDRRWSDRDVDRVLRIRRLVDDLGVNLAGAEVILHMREQVIRLRRELAVLVEDGDGGANRAG